MSGVGLVITRCGVMVKVHGIFSVFTLFLRRPGYELGPGTVTHLSSVLGGTPSELDQAIFAHVTPLCRKRLRPQNTLDLGQGERFEVGAGKRS